MIAKFLLVSYENHGVTALMRASDGMMLASVQANRSAVLQDCDPNLPPETRLFLDNEHAIRYLKEQVAPRIAIKDAKEKDPLYDPETTVISVEFESREGDSRIVSPLSGGIGKPH